jgi:hypothetical protein
MYHYILPKPPPEDAGGLLAHIASASRGSEHNVISELDHHSFFTKYLMDPEQTTRLEKSVIHSCKYLLPEANIVVSTEYVPHLTGVNKIAKRQINEGTNQVIIIFERFSNPNDTSSTGSQGHFMIMWYFPNAFDRGKQTSSRFCLFDSLGRQRNVDDPEEFYFPMGIRGDKFYQLYQWPEGDTCALWCIYALWNFCLRKVKFGKIHPIEYDGQEKTLQNENFMARFNDDLLENELTLMKTIMENSLILKTPSPSRRQWLKRPY